MLQVVEVSRFGQKNVNQYVRIVHCYPFGIAQSVYRKWFTVGTFACKFPYGFYNGGHLAWGVSLANDEIIADSIANFRKICYNYIFSFFISLQQNHNTKTAKKISFSGLFPLEQKPGFSAASDRPNRQPPISVLSHRRATPPAIKAK